VLRIGAEQLDASVFERALRDAREAELEDAVDPAPSPRAVARPALADVAYEAFAQHEARRSRS